MGLKSFFQSLKGAFWFQSPSDDLEEEVSPSKDTHDVFYRVENVEEYEEELKSLKSWAKEDFEDPRIVLNDPDVMEDYIDLSLDFETSLGDFRIVYYENDELILRGDRELVPEVKGTIEQELELNFERV
jgi:hypothetical protein